MQRFLDLDEEAQDEFRGTLASYLRAYAFLAQIMPWTDPELEELFVYGRALAMSLPPAEGEAVPLLSNAVRLTHLRTAVTADEADLGLDAGSDEPGVAFPGGGAGTQHESPMDKLSVLIATMNEKFGLDLDDADRVWFEQQKAAIRHQANGVLFEAFFSKPDFKEQLLAYLAGTYEEFRTDASA